MVKSSANSEKDTALRVSDELISLSVVKNDPTSGFSSAENFLKLKVFQKIGSFSSIFSNLSSCFDKLSISHQYYLWSTYLLHFLNSNNLKVDSEVLLTLHDLFHKILSSLWNGSSVNDLFLSDKFESSPILLCNMFDCCIQIYLLSKTTAAVELDCDKLLAVLSSVIERFPDNSKLLRFGYILSKESSSHGKIAAESLRAANNEFNAWHLEVQKIYKRSESILNRDTLQSHLSGHFLLANYSESVRVCINQFGLDDTKSSESEEELPLTKESLRKALLRALHMDPSNIHLREVLKNNLK